VPNFSGKSAQRQTVKVHSRTEIFSVDGYLVEVEADTIYGKPSVAIVGLGDTAIKEAKERLQASLNCPEYQFPKMKVVINLAPSDIKKSGSHFDLAMAVSLLLQSEQLKAENIDKFGFIGELSLNSYLRPCSGILPMAIAAKNAGLENIVVPRENIREASLVKGLNVFGLGTLQDVCSLLAGEAEYKKVEDIDLGAFSESAYVDFSEVQGQDAMIEYIVVAAAGGHNVLMIGSPGCGKSMIAKRIPTILPSLSEEEALETTKIYSVAGLLKERGGLIETRPFRAPHHNASINSLIGGGNNAVPDEISLAHNGVLFLDEITEFNKKALDGLRQPMEDQRVTVARDKFNNTYPCNFMLVAAMNPCHCGYYGQEKCRCSDYEVLKYRQKISGPIIDRIDIQKYVQPVSFMELSGLTAGHSSAELRQRVEAARNIQKKRYSSIKKVHSNAQLTPAMVKEFCTLEPAGRKVLKLAFERFQYSARSFHKFLKVARTFADMDEASKIRRQDIAAALMARDLDKEQMELLVV
jgi:magnesium chelatase family protein